MHPPWKSRKLSTLAFIIFELLLLELGFYPGMVIVALVFTICFFFYFWLIEPRLPRHQWQLPIKILPKQGTADAQHPAISDNESDDVVPLRTALLRAYESVEEARLGNEIRETTHTDEGLTSYLLNRLEETDATLYGKRVQPLSTIARAIPWHETQNLKVVGGKNDLAENVNNETIYTDVYISRLDFGKFMEYRKRKSNEPMFDSHI